MSRFAGPSRAGLAAYPPPDRWDDWAEPDPSAWPQRRERRYLLVPTTCFNCEAACGLLAYVDRETLQVRKFEGNPEHPGSRGRNCAKGPATLNQINDPDRILYPLRRQGPRGSGRWERVSWNHALDDIAARCRRAIVEGRQNEIMYHVGRPGEDGFTERVLAAWGVDGHNTHTNICSSGGRAGYQFWMGADRPSPDHARADVILLVSAHLEAGHYFNPHAQRIVEARERGARLVVIDVRCSNTASRADLWLSPHPGTEAAVLLAVANHLIQQQRYNREFVRRWWNWREYLLQEHPDLPCEFETFERLLGQLYAEYTFEFAAAEAGVELERVRELAEIVASAGTRLATHTWRAAAAGNLAGWQVTRSLFLLNALLGAVGSEGGTFPNTWHKWVPRPPIVPPHPGRWNELTWPLDYPLASNEMSFLLPHLLADGRGRLEVYFTRVYNPVWTNPDGFSWIEMLTSERKVGLHVALTPTWNESAYFADYVLPMGHASERHDLHSYETHDARWIAFRQPVLRAARERLGERVDDTRQVNPGEVWEENEFWIELSWRIDPDGSLGVRRYFESASNPGHPITVDEYYGWIFEHSVPGLAERAAAEGLSPLAYMRRYGAFELERGVGPRHEEAVAADELRDLRVDELGRAFSRAPVPAATNLVPEPEIPSDPEGRRAVGVEVDGRVLRGFPTPSGRLEFYSRTLAEWGWPELALPTYQRSHVHPANLEPEQMVLVATFRLPVQVHTRSANSKWLDEIAHSNPLWIHPADAARLGLATGALVRVSTEIGHFVVRAWVTEAIRPGVVACSHHMGRWRLPGEGENAPGQRQLMNTVSLEREGTTWRLVRRFGVAPFQSGDPDTARIWWTDAGVHQNLAFAVHPDPVSGMHCWHQAVRVRPAEPEDRYGDVVVDTRRSRGVYRRWLAMTRPAHRVSPDGRRRPLWMLRPLRPTEEAYQLPTRGDGTSARS